MQMMMMVCSSAVIPTHLESSPGHIMTTFHSAVVVGPESMAAQITASIQKMTTEPVQTNLKATIKKIQQQQWI